jgi:hypothetical protein
MYVSKKSYYVIYHNFFISCDPGETRTLGPLIKSQLLYQLSYGVYFTQRRKDSQRRKVITATLRLLCVFAGNHILPGYTFTK